MFLKLAERNKFRYEKKYYIFNYSAEQIDLIIKRNPALFSEIFYKRQVNNIYMDTGKMKHYFDNKDGVSKRLKIRIRWYGETFGEIQKPVLELKIKNNLLGTKLHYNLPSFTLGKDFSCDDMEDVFDKSNLPLYIREILRSHSFALLNSYNRKYHLSAKKDIRATVDDNLTFFEIQQRDNLFLNKLVNNEDVILELKYDLGKEKEANMIAKHLPFTPTKSSKYVYGYDNLRSINI